MKDAISIFIGSTSEGIAIAEYLQIDLEEFEPIIWDQGVFKPSKSSIENIMNASRKYKYAILVLSPDDTIVKREQISKAPRDNMIFEAGLFMSSIGRENVFILYCKDSQTTMPSDLDGVTFVPYRKRRDKKLRAAIRPAAVKIRDAIIEIEESKILSNEKDNDKDSQNSPPQNLSVFSMYVSDLLESYTNKIAGWQRKEIDKKKSSIWQQNLLGMLHDIFKNKQKDVYVIWLRPNISGRRRLTHYKSKKVHKKYMHYEFHENEGLAGKVWKTGITVGTSKLNQHPWWVYREGCDNVSYICSPVGDFKSNGGVIAVGSDLGFDIGDKEIEYVKIFASILNLSI